MVFAVDFSESDRENFEKYPTGDLWDDASLIDVVLYIWKYKGLSIPDSWVNTMEKFIESINTHVSRRYIFLRNQPLLQEIAVFKPI